MQCDLLRFAVVKLLVFAPLLLGGGTTDHRENIVEGRKLFTHLFGMPKLCVCMTKHEK